jgi:hypothetical protein
MPIGRCGETAAGDARVRETNRETRIKDYVYNHVTLLQPVVDIGSFDGCRV